MSDGPHHDWGHTFRNRILAGLTEGYVYHLDDDDITTLQSAEMIKEKIALNPGAVFYFRVVYPNEAAFSWREHRTERGWMGTGVFVHRLGIPLRRFGQTHDGDFDFTAETLKLNPERPVGWFNRVIAIIEPHRWTNLTRNVLHKGRTVGILFLAELSTTASEHWPVTI